MEDRSNKKIDPIPESIKKFFFTGVEMPNFSRDYDAIGFDADHCLVKYNIKAVTSLLVKIELNDLYENHNYPKEVLDFDYSENSIEMQACLNYSVFDIDNGTLLKIGEGKEVLAAMKGRKVLSSSEIENIYGSPIPKFQHIDWPNLHVFPHFQSKKTNGYYWTFSSFFDSCKVPQLLMGVEMIDQGKVKKSYKDLCNDLRRSIQRQYIHIDDNKKVLQASSYGNFFPEVFKNPEKYIIAQPELRDVFQKLQDQGKFLFIATNSHWEYMELILSTTLGQDWRKFFNMIFCFSCKPLFFNQQKPMYEMDRKKHDFNGKKIERWIDLKEDSMNLTYMQGNSKLLDDYLKNKLKKEQIKIAFLGDQYTSDVHYSHQNECWDGIAVIEEISFQTEEYLQIEENGPFAPLDLNLIPYHNFWGENYFIHDINNPKRNYFVDQLQKNARYAVPLVRHITNFID